MKIVVTIIIFGALMAAAGCATTKAPLPTVQHVDLPRYMGPWYVIASIPTFFEKEAFNAVEAYSLNEDGTVAVTFTYNKGAFDGPVKTMTPQGFILDSTNAVWGMRIVWPIKSDYRIAYLDDKYSEAIVARTARDHVWILARKPALSAGDYQRLVAKIDAMGYDTHRLAKVPQRP